MISNHYSVVMDFAIRSCVLEPKDDPERLSLGKRFQQKIDEERRAKQAGIEAQKNATAEQRNAAAKRRLRDDLPTLPGPDIPVNRSPSNHKETIIHPIERKNEKNRSDLPELDMGHMASPSVKQNSLPSPPLSGTSQFPPSKPGSRYPHDRSESELIPQLQAELGWQKDYIKRLEVDLKSVKHEVRRLRTERDQVQQERLEAIRHNEKKVAADLNEQVAQLVRLVEDARKRERELEIEVDEGRSRERDLTHQFDEMKRENVRLVGEIEVLRSPKSPESPPSSDSRPKDKKAKRASSSRGGSRPEKTRFEFSVRRGERFSTAALCKGFVNSLA